MAVMLAERKAAQHSIANLGAAIRIDRKAAFVAAVLHHVLDTGLCLGERYLDIAVLRVDRLALFKRIFTTTVYHLHTTPRYEIVSLRRAKQESLHGAGMELLPSLWARDKH